MVDVTRPHKIHTKWFGTKEWTLEWTFTESSSRLNSSVSRSAEQF